MENRLKSVSIIVGCNLLPRSIIFSSVPIFWWTLIELQRRVSPEVLDKLINIIRLIESRNCNLPAFSIVLWPLHYHVVAPDTTYELKHYYISNPILSLTILLIWSIAIRRFKFAVIIVVERLYGFKEIARLQERSYAVRTQITVKTICKSKALKGLVNI